MGIDNFNNNKDFDYLKEIEPPDCFNYLYLIFLDLYQNCGREHGYTYTDIKNYMELNDYHFSLYEIRMLMNCKTWANREISKLDKD